MSMFEKHEATIRYHFSGDFVLGLREPVHLERYEPETNTWSWQGEVPEDSKTPELLTPFLREAFLARGGTAWRASTGRGEHLRVFSIFDRARELGGQSDGVREPIDKFYLSEAVAQSGVAKFW